MPRQLKVAPITVALALGLGLALASGPAAAQEGHGSSAAKAAEGVVKTVEHGLTEAGKEIKEAGHKAGEHEAAGEPNILEPQPTLALWTVVVFLGLLFVLGKFAWKPLLAALHHREEHLEHVLLETERARNESEQLLAEHRRRMTEAEEQVRALIEEGRRNATAAGDEIVKKAQAEAEASKHRAERDISSAKDQALAEIKTRTADLAVSVAAKVLARTLSGDDQSRLIDAATAEISGANGHGGRS